MLFARTGDVDHRQQDGVGVVGCMHAGGQRAFLILLGLELMDRSANCAETVSVL